MNKIEPILEKIGLTFQESKVYLTLIELQEAQTGLLCKTTNIASSNIYKILDSLKKKGLISYKLKNNIKVFMPSPPEALNELILEKQKTLDQERKDVINLISNLKVKKIEKESESNYKYYEGITGIKSMWYEINEKMDKEHLIRLYSSKKESYERLIGFYKEHHKLRKKKEVKERIIFPKEDMKLAKKRKNKYTEIKFMELKNDVEWGVANDMAFFQYITGKVPRGFLIKDKKFSKTFEQVFDQLWKKAKRETNSHLKHKKKDI